MWRETNGDNLMDELEDRELGMTGLDFQRANELEAGKWVRNAIPILNLVCPSVLVT